VVPRPNPYGSWSRRRRRTETRKTSPSKLWQNALTKLVADIFN
jgi:hypothetical protein